MQTGHKNIQTSYNCKGCGCPACSMTPPLHYCTVCHFITFLINTKQTELKVCKPELGKGEELRQIWL